MREIIEKEKRIVTLDLAFVEPYNVLWKRMYLQRDKLDVERLTASAGLFISIVEVKTAYTYLKDALDIGLREASQFTTPFHSVSKIGGRPVGHQ